MSASIVNYPHKLRLRVPAGLPEALRRAARLNHTSSSEWARQALIRGLAAQGVALSEVAQADQSGHQSHEGEAA
jgi:hypothetical protein